MDEQTPPNLAADRCSAQCQCVLTWKSPSDDANEYNSVMVVNWMSEYSALMPHAVNQSIATASRSQSTVLTYT